MILNIPSSISLNKLLFKYLIFTADKQGLHNLTYLKYGSATVEKGGNKPLTTHFVTEQ